MRSLIRSLGSHLVREPRGKSDVADGAPDAVEIGDAVAAGVTPPASDAADLIAEADRLRDARQWSEAADAYDAALKAAPERADIWVQYGHALKESGRLSDAEGAYRQSLALKPDLSDTHLQLGHLLKMLGRMQAAARAYVAAASLDREGADALKELDALLRKRVDVPEPLLIEALGDFPADLPPPTDWRRPAGAEAALQSAGEALEALVEAKALKGSAGAALKTALKHIDASLAATEGQAAAQDAARTTLVFDVADLFSYFRNARMPTGIQRVQIEVISGLLRARDPGCEVKVCCFGEDADTWVEAPADMFLSLCDLALSSGDVKAPVWVSAIVRLGIYLRVAKPFELPRGAYLINLGTSWWLQNYFLNIRRVKRERGVRYVPFVHDLIPIMTPEHCIRELTLDFITWTLGVFQHADLFLVNSEATKRDLLTVAARLGHDPDPDALHVVRLDADFRRSETAGEQSDILRRQGLKPDGYVLFVSTIESRKNHVGAFNAWLSLVRRHGADKVPQLVCVGAKGWLNDVVHELLASSLELQQRVTLLSRLSDDELACLYRNCLFTLYPSHYEGWGLPVTEALSWGKASVISDASSLPEAGGRFADYFRAGSEIELVAAAERMIFDADHRTAREALIRSEFKPRAWTDIGAEILGIVAADERQARDETAAGAIRPRHDITARLGVYYPIIRNDEARIWRGLVAGEMFRAGSGWWHPDDWGVWTRPSGGDLVIGLDGPHKTLRAYFLIRGLIGEECRYRFDIQSPEGISPIVGVLGKEERRWLYVDLPASPVGLSIRASLSCDSEQDLARQGDGEDRRVTGIGLMGLFVCETDDLVTRLLFAEAVALADLTPLTPGYDARPR